MFCLCLPSQAPLYTPYFGLCLDNYDMWQCYADKCVVRLVTRARCLPKFAAPIILLIMAYRFRTRCHNTPACRLLTKNTRTKVSATLYRETWFFYSLYRMGLSLQLICLSMTVLTWSDFLSYVRRDARVALTDTPEHKKLVRALLIINGIDLTISLLVNGFIALYPTEAEGASGGDLNFWVYLNWLFLDVMQVLSGHKPPPAHACISY